MESESIMHCICGMRIARVYKGAVGHSGPHQLDLTQTHCSGVWTGSAQRPTSNQMRSLVLNLPTLLLLPLLLSLSPPLPAAGIRRVPSFMQLPVSLDFLFTGAWGSFKNLLDAGPGDSSPDIVSFKQYLAQFGYLNLTGVQKVSDRFDSQTVAALELYQRSFRLPGSGKVDIRTLMSIMMPRCGREDVEGGIPVMLELNDMSDTGGEAKEARHYSFFPSKPRWPVWKRNLTYVVKGAMEEGRREALRRAFREWEGVLLLNFREIEEEGEGNADIEIAFVSYEHGDGKPFDGAWGVLAHAFSPPDGRMHMDSSEHWHWQQHQRHGQANHHKNRRKMRMQEVDLQSVATHEVGHLLGLSHSGDPDSVMYPTVSPGEVKRRLSPDDIAGVQSLYGGAASPAHSPRKGEGAPPPRWYHLIPRLMLMWKLLGVLQE